MKILYPIIMSSFLILGLTSIDHAVAAQDSYHFSQDSKLDFTPDEKALDADQQKDKKYIEEDSELASGGSPFDFRKPH